MHPDPAQRLAALAELGEADPATIATHRTEGDALALSVGGDAGLRWRIAVLKSLIAHPPDDDAIRELYGELVDRYRSDPPRLAQLRLVGDEIRRLEAEGILPSTLVARHRS
jgi:hypothetical protein